MQNQESGHPEATVIQLLEARPGKARFVAEIGAFGQRRGMSADDLERALASLEAAGRIIVRQQFCGDPHLTGIDLRVVGLVDPDSEEAESRAVASIEAAWQRWLGDYLSSHCCG